MALTIHTNYSSLLTQTNLNKTNNALATNQQRLGTGLRINSAADDAAGLQIATRMNAQTKGMAVALRNVSDASSLLQTADGALNEMTDIMQRMKDLATQSANGTNSDADRKSMQAEYNELGKELSNIMENSSFAGEKLFSKDGTSGKFDAEVSFQIGATKDETLALNVSGSLTTLASGMDDVSQSYTSGNVSGAVSGTEITTITGAQDMIDKLTDSLDNIGELRGQFGANINRLNHTANNLANIKDNTEMARGRIMDADFASESAMMSKNSMLMQSGISMLKQTGQMPSMVMSLLG
ncbi:lateral flagellin LafA [Pseudomonas fragi]|jgi:flagellin|uniref:Flagellin n=1 Tax=Pseudomonas fragi TaxID=296 RepID=A0A9Q5B484_PSEFR|nr:lateral flagellin LafA [Pseudomonas fragi]MBM1198433.1 Lateral flagellin [Pseudomonas fragi]NNB16276.1 Lateral flagellin [Pseudomonas fragi]NNB22731.1 Lateral flagellin [Pseudomonas fragi]NNB27480.1 Lateral flagellin [Pseudomonas fragi]NNB34681.1 Lateral flagellin [Pseudomonas fragi]